MKGSKDSEFCQRDSFTRKKRPLVVFLQAPKTSSENHVTRPLFQKNYPPKRLRLSLVGIFSLGSSDVFQAIKTFEKSSQGNMKGIFWIYWKIAKKITSVKSKFAFLSKNFVFKDTLFKLIGSVAVFRIRGVFIDSLTQFVSELWSILTSKSTIVVSSGLKAH